MIKTVLADDHQIFMEGLEMILEPITDIKVIGTACSKDELFTILKNEIIDILILDISFGESNGLDLIESLLAMQSELRIIILSMHAEENFIRKGIEKGASGYILKRSTKMELEQGIKAVNLGENYYCKQVSDIVMANVGKRNKSIRIELTSRELDVLELVAKGYKTNVIADKLFIAPSTVKSHRKNMLEKFNVKNTAELVKFATDNNLLT